MTENKSYPFSDIEKKWQKSWQNSYRFDSSSDKEKYYVLEMFPYPSGNIHMGHLRNYAIGDVIARTKTKQGYNVLHPMGWDAFGLPAENAAIEKKTHPQKWTEQNIKNMKVQLSSIGLSYDWDQEIATCTPEYFKHEQKFFLDFLKKGIAYQKETYVNWDPVDQTVLANEQVVEGRGWRSGALIERKKLNGWFLKVSDYAEELLSELENLKEWPTSVSAMQEKWIGKSTGALVKFDISGRSDKLEIYTTRPETLFGASFCALAPQHPLSLELAKGNADLHAFIEEHSRNTSTQEAIDKAPKEGFDTGLKVAHPFIKDKFLPVYVANFVLMDYGTGAIFACPAHDPRDFAFAKKYNLPITQVVSGIGTEEELEEAYTGDGQLVNSDFLNGMSAADAKLEAIARLEKLNLGEAKVNYKIRDWGVSRQRYWGCPIPIIYCDSCGTVPVPEKDLPVELPQKGVSFEQTGNPLENHEDWKNCKCPNCGKDAVRETDTFDTFFESSWYFFRFCDAQNSELGFAAEKANKFLPVDQYIGGIEHAVLHLLYARFFTKALRDIGMTSVTEPFKRLLTQGMVTNISFKNKDGAWVEVSEVEKQGDKYINAKTKEEVFAQRVEKMSKSKKNGLSPVDIIANYGADTARLFMLSDSPPEKDLEWSDSGLEGAWRYLNKIWRFVNDFENTTKFDDKNLSKEQKELLFIANQSINNVTEDIEKFHLNRAVARIRELSNAIVNFKINSDNDKALIAKVLNIYCILLFPITPHYAAELWEVLGNEERLDEVSWPEVEKKYLTSSNVTIAVQVNGKLRATFETDTSISKEDQEKQALALNDIQNRIKGQEVKKVIVVPGKIVNIVAV